MATFYIAALWLLGCIAFDLARLANKKPAATWMDRFGILFVAVVVGLCSTKI